MTIAEKIAALSIQDRDLFETLSEAVEQYVSNQEDHVELSEEPSEEDLRKLQVAEDLQDKLAGQLVALLNG